MAGISLATPEQHSLYPEGVGFPLAGVSVEIVDENDAAIAPGEIGRIRVCKANMVSRYASDPLRGSETGGSIQAICSRRAKAAR